MTARMRRGLLLPLLACLALACKGEIPEKLSYHFMIQPPLSPGQSEDMEGKRLWNEQNEQLEPLTRSTLLRNGEVLSPLEYDSFALRGDFEYPSSTLPSALLVGTWTVETPTLCGKQTLPLTPTIYGEPDRDEELRSGRTLSLNADLIAPDYEPAQLFIDWGEGNEGKTLKIGTLELPHDLSSLTVFNLDCPASAEVSVDGEVIGTWKQGDEVTLISLLPEPCYTFQWVAYGDNVASGNVGVLPKQAVQPLPGAPEAFLEPLPSSIDERSLETVFGEMLRADSCPSEP